MNPEMRALIERESYCRATMNELAALLPKDDGELDLLIGDTVARSDQLDFIYIVMAALIAERPVQARHLRHGLILMPERWTLGVIATHMVGDIATPLAEAVTSVKLDLEVLAAAVYLAAWWRQEHGGGKVSGPLLAAARSSARNRIQDPHVLMLFMGTAVLAEDANLKTILAKQWDAKRGKMTVEELAKRSQEGCVLMIKGWSKPPRDMVPETASPTLAAEGTLRRSVARVGRNEPCPCGSGKKYKHCCIAQDAERLRQSTAFAGVTTVELRAHPEPYLTELDLEENEIHEVARYDPLKIPTQLLIPYLARLCRAKMYEASVVAMEKLGFSKDIEDAWENICIRCAQAQRRDLVDRLLALKPDARQHRMHGGIELLLAGEDPAKLVEEISSGAFHLLTEAPREDLVGYTHMLLNSRFCALGILVARGMVSILPRQEASAMLEELLKTRDKLNLSPDDPASDVLDKLFLSDRADASKEATALRDAESKLEAKIHEVQRYKDNVERLQKEVARRELKAKPVAAAAPVPASPADEHALSDLREKVAALKATLKERHHERNTLRRELQQAHSDLEALRLQAKPATPTGAVPDEADHEEDLLLPQESAGTQPLRIIEYPHNFRDSLIGLPRSVSRGTLTMLGRLSAGDPAAYVGAVRLKACPSVMRQRIGIDHRLLFRLLPDRVQVVDLIPRQDLERKIKTLV